MPAKPLSPQQKRDAEKLKTLFNAWRDANPGPDGRRLSQEVMATKFPFGQSALSQYLNGTIPLNKEVAVKFATVLGCNVDDFSLDLNKELAALTPPNTIDDDFVEVERAEVAFSNGRGHLVFVEGKRSSLSFRRDYLRRIGVSTKHATVVNAQGRSNEPDIKDGSVLLVNRAPQEIRNGKFYAFRKDGELLVKKLFVREGGSILAQSANDDKEEYPDIILESETEDFELLGRVMWMAAEL